MTKILLIEDDQLVSKTLKILLAKKGFEVECAFNALEALTLVAVRDFDLVISDIRMPELDGIALLKYVRTKSSVPFIVMTGLMKFQQPSQQTSLNCAAALSASGS